MTVVAVALVGCHNRPATDQDLRATIGAALSRSGHTLPAAVVEPGESTLTRVPAPSCAGRQALLLTGQLTGADDGSVGNERPAGELMYVDDIEFE